MNKITELPSSAYSDEQTLLAAQRVAIFGYDPCAEIHSNRIVQEGGTSGSAEAAREASRSWMYWSNTSADPYDWIGTSSNVFRDVKVAASASDNIIREASFPGELTASEAEALGWLDEDKGEVVAAELVGDDGAVIATHVMDSDACRILSMAAKNAKPAPEPVLSIGGSEFNTAELLEALQLVRAKHAPAVKETPRGLMVVREFDHRLGLWGGEGC